MDRLTGKTMDCYVEFFSVGDAQAAVNAKTRLGNIHKLGDRVAFVEMSTQDELMKELFPKAKQVEWQGGVPVVVDTNEPFNSGFKSFVSQEELVMLVKHAEFPQRVRFPISSPICRKRVQYLSCYSLCATTTSSLRATTSSV